LDTATCGGNGREQAKTPLTTKRVVDTCDVIGMWNDKEVDFDPDSICSYYGNAVNFPTTEKDNDPLTGKSNTAWWNEMKMRMGDLRADGVWLGAAGMSAKDATLKYEMAGNITAPADYGGTNQMTLQCWAKTTWHVNDSYEHEFCNFTSLQNSSTVAFSKGRRFTGTWPSDPGGPASIKTATAWCCRSKTPTTPTMPARCSMANAAWRKSMCRNQARP